MNVEVLAPVPIPLAQPFNRDWRVNYARKSRIAISNIRATQAVVHPARVASLAAAKRWPAIRLFSLGNNTWGVADGHHRIAAALCKGRTHILALLDEEAAQ